jgi:hypothetical protein
MCLRTFQVDGMIKNFVKNLWKKIQPKKVEKYKVFWLPELPKLQNNFFLGQSS